MIYFKGHKLIKKDDEYVLILYTNPCMYEFAQEFFTEEQETKKAFENKVLDYIKENLPDIKIKTINIMLGALLIASVPFSSIQAKAQSMDTTQAESVSDSVYRVKTGDTLYKIATKYGTTVKNLKLINNLSSDMIYIGQELKIYETNTYIVKSGDTLYKISKAFNISVSEIKSLNNLSTDLIYPGQVLNISKAYYLNYTVRDGDYLYKIAEQFNSSVGAIKSINNLNNNMIYSGQKLAIPFSDDSNIVNNPSSVLAVVNKNNRLPSDYVPSDLGVPNIPFTFKEYSSKKLMKKEAKVAIEKLFAKAKEDSINLLALSGYRSYSYQEYIFTNKAMERGIETANMTSAIPGQSEHQTGLAMDVTSAGANYQLTQYFGNTPEGIWLKENAADFGFILRYPQGKENITGYSYEPWHIRYVGKEAAKIIYQQNITLEQYVGIY